MPARQHRKLDKEDIESTTAPSGNLGQLVILPPHGLEVNEVSSTWQVTCWLNCIDLV